ncbi:hypothetical protein BH10ACI1_BH10ACI1_24550 [soil metagenome]
MNSLQNDFLKRSVAALEKLIESVKKEADLPTEVLRESFRILHTIKGTSQTFGFSASAKIAHELESLLAAIKENNFASNEGVQHKLIEGLVFLIDSLKKGEKSQQTLVDKVIKPAKNDLVLPQNFTFDPELLKQFSEHEKKIILAEVSNGKNIFLVDMVFELRNFSDEFKKLREILLEKGEIIATFPNPGVAEKNKIGFRVCFASAENAKSLRKIAENFTVVIIQQNTLPENELEKILSRIAPHCKDLARKSGKEIEFQVFASQISLPPEISNLLFDILLHLTRNAVDHAIEPIEVRLTKGKKQNGTIKISLKRTKIGFKIVVADDGKGLDLNKIKAKAIEKGHIFPDKILTESEMLDLIYLPEFSTAETLTEISGRGVGLDAVKKLVENANGKINVKSRRDFGTTFEVILHYEKRKFNE